MKFLAILAVGFASSSLAAPTSPDPQSLESSITRVKNPVGIVARQDTKLTEEDGEPVENVIDIIVKVQETVTVKVDDITVLLDPATDKKSQIGLVPVLVEVLDEIRDELSDAVEAILAEVLPTALGTAGDVLELVSELLQDVLSLVNGPVTSLVVIVEGLLDPLKALVIAELRFVLAVLGPLIMPILGFVTAIAGGEDGIKETLAQVLDVVDEIVSVIGLPVLHLD